MNYWDYEPGTWDYDKGLELYNELRYDDLEEIEQITQPDLEPYIPENTCLICKIKTTTPPSCPDPDGHEEDIERYAS